jgi:RNA polymerase sigma factor (sigma-70 family)
MLTLVKTAMTSLSKVDITDYESTVKAVVNRLLLSRRISQYSIEREDLYQIGWIAVMDCIKTYDGSRGAKFETYATIAIIHAVNKELKRLSDRKAYTITLDSPAKEISVIADEIMCVLINVVENSNKFSHLERNIFWLKFTDGLSFTEIGKLVGSNRETVRQTYHEAMRRVKELLPDEF